MSSQTRTPTVAVITGASAGVGRATAHEFARHGVGLGLIGRSPEALADTAAEVQALGGRAITIPADVADSAAIERAADQVESSLGPIDVWVNNASNTIFAPITDTQPEEFRRITEVVYLGTVHGTLAALRRMIPRDEGTIVQVSSALGYRAIPLQAAYCAGKHAVHGFTQSLRCELLHDGSGVQVTVVQLPALNTPQFGWARNKMPRRAQPMPPIYQPELAGRAIYHAALHPRREISVGGSTVFGLLAERLVPWLADRYLARVGYDGQQDVETETPGRSDNLYEPLPGAHATHGRFGDRAKPDSVQFRFNAHRGLVATSVGITLATTIALRRLSRR